MKAEDVINIAKTAEILGISRASIRNWIKHGYLQPSDQEGRFFYLAQVAALKDSIAEGLIDRLQKRANRVGSAKNFIPSEYISLEENKHTVNTLVNHILINKLDRNSAILGIAINLFKANGDITPDGAVNFSEFRPSSFKRENVRGELREFYSEMIAQADTLSESGHIAASQALDYIIHYSLPKENDLLGLVYQSLLNEGKKASLGSYFTPSEIVEMMLKDNLKHDQKVLDPCCGTGQFLLSFANVVSKPENIWGIDVDLTAVRIARFNLLLKYSIDFQPNIYHLNALRDINDEPSFDFIATNPPWGAEIDQLTRERMQDEFSMLNSGESFSYFLGRSLSLLKAGGTLSVVLPESILNVRTHRDIRKYILENCEISRISCLGKRFKSVLSSVIQMDLIKVSPSSHNLVEIKTPLTSYTVRQSRFLDNKWHVFDVYLRSEEEEIIQKIYGTEHLTLQAKADWALGIVTGDNRKFLVSKQEEGYEPIFAGSDVEGFVLKEPTRYIKFKPELFQQVAPEERYRAKEKLIYRFISGQLVFAYDDKGSLTLNSANILIPRFPSIPMKATLALLNSSIYRFLYAKKFNSIKILRGDLEQLPFPLWDKDIIEVIVQFIDQIIQGEPVHDQLDTLIMEQFGLTSEERAYILSFPGRRKADS